MLILFYSENIKLLPFSKSSLRVLAKTVTEHFSDKKEIKKKIIIIMKIISIHLQHIIIIKYK